MLRILTAIVSLLLPAIASAGTGPSGELQPFVKCGTPAVLEAYEANGYRLMASTRYFSDYIAGYISDLDTALPIQAVSPGGHFRAHFDTTGTDAPSLADDNGNSIPDYVDSTLVYLEYAWDLLIDELGYEAPRSDDGRGGGDEVDVYILNMYGYGETHPEDTVNDSSASYMIIDNDFTGMQYATKGYAALRVTTAHEFFHVIHFSYFTDMTMLWWMEHSSVWMEERAWEDVNDYLAYVNSFFSQKMTSLNNNSMGNLFMYGAGIWPMYLARRFGDDQIRLIWENARDTGNHTITCFDEVIPGGLAEAFNEFATWNYFIGPRANSYFHSDSPLFEVNDVVDATYSAPPVAGSLDTNALTSRYIEFRFPGCTSGSTLAVNLMKPGGMFAGKLILHSDTGDFQIESLEDGENLIPLNRTWDSATMVVSCTNTYGTGFIFEFEGDMTTVSVEEENAVPEAFAVSAPHPNPFNPATTIGFTMPSEGDVAITAFNLQGQAVDEIARGLFPAGSHRIDWRPDGLAGGLYFIRIVTPQGAKTVKSLYLK